MEVTVFQDKKVIVVMPAYNAAKTFRKTYEERMGQGAVDRPITQDPSW